MCLAELQEAPRRQSGGDKFATLLTGHRRAGLDPGAPLDTGGLVPHRCLQTDTFNIIILLFMISNY